MEEEREQERPEDRTDEGLKDRRERDREQRGDDEAENSRIETVVRSQRNPPGDGRAACVIRIM
jgi:hypothetical protein